jgi:hypothetical protein
MSRTFAGRSGDLVAQLNANWRVVIVSDRNAWLRPAWMIQHRLDDAWRDQAAVRASGMLRGLVKAYAGPVDAAAAKILDALQDRVDLRVPTQKPRRREPQTNSAADCESAAL